VLASFVLSLALTITALAVPGAQPVLIAAGAVLLAGLVAANFIKPGVLTDLKHDFSDFFRKIGKEISYTGQKNKVKQSVGQKNHLDEVVQETIADARKKHVLAGSHQGHHESFFKDAPHHEKPEHKTEESLTKKS
jgi:hypothetical protein